MVPVSGPFRPSADAAPTPQRQVRLSAQARQELVARYEAGVFKKELARMYGVHVETVRAIIARHSTPVTQPRGL